MKITELRNKIIDTLNEQKIRIEGDERDEFFNYGIDTCIGYIEDILGNCEVVEDDLRRNIKDDSKCSY